MSARPLHSRYLLSVLTLLAVGCGGTARHASHATDARARARVAVLPSVWATETPPFGIDPSASLAGGLEAAGTMEAIQGPAVQDALSAQAAQVAPAAGDDHDVNCAEDSECVRAVGERLSVDRVAALRLASLGTTVVVRVRLMEVDDGAAETASQTVVEDATEDRVHVAVQAIGHELAPPSDRVVEEDRWYQKWWVWTLVGAAVVGGAAAITVAAQPEGQDPDFVITPPSPR